jgi:mannose-6-phosphate isomerase-like protein (cupin superfamily)
MATEEQKLAARQFDSPDERRPFARGRTEVVAIGGVTLGLATFEPGWRWSDDIKPLAGTEHCEVTHVGYMLSGRMAARMKDGSEMEFGKGDLVFIPPGHDGWTVGDEPAVFLQILGAGEYAKKR